MLKKYSFDLSEYQSDLTLFPPYLFLKESWKKRLQMAKIYKLPLVMCNVHLRSSQKITEGVGFCPSTVWVLEIKCRTCWHGGGKWVILLAVNPDSISGT